MIRVKSLKSDQGFCSQVILTLTELKFFLIKIQWLSLMLSALESGSGSNPYMYNAYTYNSLHI